MATAKPVAVVPEGPRAAAAGQLPAPHSAAWRGAAAVGPGAAAAAEPPVAPWAEELQAAETAEPPVAPWAAEEPGGPSAAEPQAAAALGLPQRVASLGLAPVSRRLPALRPV
jgi:hypothetical protein